MATPQTRSFSGLIKEYMPYDLLAEELIKRDWLLSNSEFDQSYKGGTLYVPFEGAQESTIQYGNYAGQSNITQFQPVKASINGYKELWGSMIFNDSDLDEHGDLERSFLKVLPSRLNGFIGRMREAVSRALLTGSHIAVVTTTASANNGLLIVDKPELFELGQEVSIEDYTAFPGTAQTTVSSAFVRAINMETKTLTLYDARTGGSVIDFSGNVISAGTGSPGYGRVYHPGGLPSQTNQFLSMKSALLSAANGGSSTLYGQTKLSYPYLQAHQESGSAITAATILDGIFDAFTNVKKVGKGNPSKAVMSYKHGASVMKALEVSRMYSGGDRKANAFGWTEMQITGVAGMLDVVFVNEMDDDVIFMLEPGSWKIYSNGMFKRRKDPDGKEYFTLRGESGGQGTGYQYIVDTKFFGDMIIHAPSHNGVIHSISY